MTEVDQDVPMAELAHDEEDGGEKFSGDIEEGVINSPAVGDEDDDDEISDFADDVDES